MGPVRDNLEEGGLHGGIGLALYVGAEADDTVVEAEDRLAGVKRAIVLVVAMQLHAPNTVAAEGESVAETLVAEQHLLEAGVNIQVLHAA